MRYIWFVLSLIMFGMSIYSWLTKEIAYAALYMAFSALQYGFFVNASKEDK